MKDAIFAPSFGNRPSSLVGREDVLDRFEAGLSENPGSRERAMLLLGQRGSGKTVLLWELADRARQKGFVIASPTAAADDMLVHIIEKIQDDGQRYIKASKGKVVGGSLGAFGFSAGLQFGREEQETKSFQYKLTQLCRALTGLGHGVLLLIDEVQANSTEMRQLVVAYQEIVGEGLDIAIVMAGLPAAVSATLNDKVLTFLNRARKIELAPLRISEVDAFYADAFERMGLSIDAALRRQAAEATMGSPYMMQLVGHNLALYSGEGGEVGEKALGAALASSKADFENDVCRTTVAALSDQDVSFLGAMAEDEGESESSIGDIARRMGVSDDYAQKYRRRLISAGIIEATRRGYVAFAVPYLEDYLRHER